MPAPTYKNYIPRNAITLVEELLDDKSIRIVLKTERKTKHGDYKRLSKHQHQISINTNLNPYRFLITFIHEVAHFEAFQKYGYGIKPHGKEWKSVFQHMMLPFLRPDIFPKALLPILAQHFKNPKASSDSDMKLALTLKQYDNANEKVYVFEIPEGDRFKLYNGKVFVKGKKRRKRIECQELGTQRLYLFNPIAEVEHLTA